MTIKSKVNEVKQKQAKRDGTYVRLTEELDRDLQALQEKLGIEYKSDLIRILLEEAIYVVYPLDDQLDVLQKKSGLDRKVLIKKIFTEGMKKI